ATSVVQLLKLRSRGVAAPARKPRTSGVAAASASRVRPRYPGTLSGALFALVVSLKVKPDKRDQFLAAAEDDSTCSVRDEPGCLRFDVLQDQSDANHFYFYEVYLDEAAFGA